MRSALCLKMCQFFVATALLLSGECYAQWRPLRPADCLTFGAEVSLKGKIFRRLYPIISPSRGTISSAQEVHSLLLLDKPICIVDRSSAGSPTPGIIVLPIIDLNTETDGPNPHAPTMYDVDAKHALVHGLLERPQENLGPSPFIEVYSYVLQ
jgi:hypothetical protein